MVVYASISLLMKERRICELISVVGRTQKVWRQTEISRDVALSLELLQRNLRVPREEENIPVLVAHLGELETCEAKVIRGMKFCSLSTGDVTASFGVRCCRHDSALGR